MATLTEALTARLSTREHPSGNTDTHAHASESGKCARAIWYRIHQTPPTDAHPLTTLISFRIGSDLHLAVQDSLIHLHPFIELEVAWTRGQVSGHADAVYHSLIEQRTVVEIKTAGPFAWKYMTEPKREHLLQASVNALALEADHIHIIYLNIAAKSGDDPIREFFLPVDRPSALGEFDRLACIAAAPELVDAEYEGRSVHPDFDKFPCGWCAWRTRCAGDDQ